MTISWNSFILTMFGLLLFCTAEDIFSDEMINEINSRQKLWRAGKNFDNERAKQLIETLSRVKDPNKGEWFSFKRPRKRDMLPPIFDARKYWPRCKTMKTVPDQGRCGNCWALSMTATLSKRLCVQSNGRYDVHVSADDITRCCAAWQSDCSPHSHGCYGGIATQAYRYWVEKGIVTGGYYQSKEGCAPYSHELFNFLELYNESLSKPPKKMIECFNNCSNSEYTKPYHEDRMRGYDVNYLHYQHPMYIQIEIMNNGPVQAEMEVYKDFMTYQYGIYFHVSKNENENASWHGVVIIGWGEENGVNYWLVSNTWGSHWGKLGGYFKIRRGINECEIESSIYAPIYRFGQRTVNKTVKDKPDKKASSSTTSTHITNLILTNFITLIVTCT